MFAGGLAAEFCDDGLNEGARGVFDGADSGAGAAGDGADAGDDTGREDCWIGRGRPAGLLNGLFN